MAIIPEILDNFLETPEDGKGKRVHWYLHYENPDEFKGWSYRRIKFSIEEDLKTFSKSKHSEDLKDFGRIECFVFQIEKDHDNNLCI